MRAFETTEDSVFALHQKSRGNSAKHQSDEEDAMD
jgi:hypothetical protein